MMTSLRPATWLAELRARARALFRRRAAEQNLTEEIRFHLEMETEANIRRGMAPDEARRAALVAFGGVERVREDHRDARGTRLLDDAFADLRYGVRWLARSPGFTLPAILTLALGVGGATAVACVVDGVLLRPLPYPQPDRLAVVRSLTRGETQAWNSSPPDFRAFRDDARGFERLGAYYDVAANLMLGGEPARLSAARATAGMFPLLGVPPLLGRAFRAEEEVAGSDRVVLLSHALWRNRFGESRAVLGSSVTIDGAASEITPLLTPMPPTGSICTMPLASVVASGTVVAPNVWPGAKSMMGSIARWLFAPRAMPRSPGAVTR